jgi:hypothetical protein
MRGGYAGLHGLSSLTRIDPPILCGFICGLVGVSGASWPSGLAAWPAPLASLRSPQIEHVIKMARSTREKQYVDRGFSVASL